MVFKVNTFYKDNRKLFLHIVFYSLNNEQVHKLTDTVLHDGSLGTETGVVLLSGLIREGVVSFTCVDHLSGRDVPVCILHLWGILTTIIWNLYY